jgi:hypothetical protein
MQTRYTVQYWYTDEHATLEKDFDTLEQAANFAAKIDKEKFKDIEIYGRHWKKINETIIIDNAHYSIPEWELINDDYYENYDLNGNKE